MAANEKLLSTHPVLVDVHGPQIRIEEQTLWLQIHWRLATSLVAERPFRIDETPKGGTCKARRGGKRGQVN